VKFRQYLTDYLFKRNWHYTINRRSRTRGWDIRPWPNKMALFGFNPEISDLITQTRASDTFELGEMFEGLSIILKNDGRLYSQLCQELFVAAKTKEIPKPFYLEIGAFHPEKYSNTAALRKFLGWTGLSVDPSLETQSFFEDAGLGDSFLNVGVGATSGVAYFLANGAFSQTRDLETENSIKVDILGIRELIEIHPKVDYVSLDIEGGELEIMKVFPWDICKPQVFTIEHNDEKDVKNKLESVMSSAGYRQVLESVTNFESWFVLIK
jgi:hypothetical protein